MSFVSRYVEKPIRIQSNIDPDLYWTVIGDEVFLKKFDSKNQIWVLKPNKDQSDPDRVSIISLGKEEFFYAIRYQANSDPLNVVEYAKNSPSQRFSLGSKSFPQAIGSRQNTAKYAVPESGHVENSRIIFGNNPDPVNKNVWNAFPLEA